MSWKQHITPTVFQCAILTSVRDASDTIPGIAKRMGHGNVGVIAHTAARMRERGWLTCVAIDPPAYAATESGRSALFAYEEAG